MTARPLSIAGALFIDRRGLFGRIATACLAAAIACAASGCHRGASDEHGQDPAAPVAVTCQPARTAPASSTVTLRGVIGVPPDRDAVVAPQVAGRLSEVRVHEGDRVSRGDLLATVDDPALEPALREAEAARAAARANLDNANATLTRARRLLDQGIAPRRQVDDAQARQAGAEADYQAAQARAALARKNHDRRRVTAPISGVAVRVLRRAGELVDGTPATPVVEIADPTVLELRADAAAEDLVRVREGSPVSIELDALPGRTLTGQVVFVSPAVDTATSLGVVRATITPPPAGSGQLKIGLAARMNIDVAQSGTVVVVPAAAMRRGSDGREEVVVCAAAPGGGHAAEVRPVEVAGRTGDVVEITRGVRAGERVVTTHLLGLEDGAAIQPAAGSAR